MAKEFDISKLEKLCKDIDKKGRNIRAGIKKAVSKTGKQCQSIAKKMAPVDSGQLRLSINTETKEEYNKVISEVFPTVEHAPYPEFGTGQKGMASQIERPEGIHYSANWKGQDAQPYMYPAYLQTRDKLSSNIEKELNKILKGD